MKLQSHFMERLAEKQDDLWSAARTVSAHERVLYFAARHPRFMTYVVPTLAFVAGALLFT